MKHKKHLPIKRKSKIKKKTKMKTEYFQNNMVKTPHKIYMSPKNPQNNAFRNIHVL